MSGSDQKPLPTDRLWTPQTIMGLIGMAIVAGTVGAVFAFADKLTQTQTVGGVMTFGGVILGFYFGSSKGSQDKDATAPAPTPPFAGGTPAAWVRSPPPLPPPPTPPTGA